MTALSQLRSDADMSSISRNHKPVWDTPYNSGKHEVQNGHCENCRGWVQINTDPLPNDTEIGGTMVALDCPMDMRYIEIDFCKQIVRGWETKKLRTISPYAIEHWHKDSRTMQEAIDIVIAKLPD